MKLLIWFAESAALFILAICIVALASAVADANEPPPSNLPAVVAKTATTEVCRCGVACECAEAFTVVHKTSKATADTKAAPTLPVKDQVREHAPAYRAPIGHTHTCTKCGTSWDHTANPTHKCANCGGSPPMAARGGYYADPVARPVRVDFTAPAARPVVVHSLPAQLPVFTFKQSNCANGNCQYAR